MKIYTKTGDLGETGLFRGARVRKHDLRVEAYGNVDELNAIVGLAVTFVQVPEISKLLSSIQHELFEIGADLATPPQPQDAGSVRVTSSLTERLEREIDSFEAQLPVLKNFILPGGSKSGALIHYSRAVCRRAERSVTRLQESQEINPEIIRYLNRLSDLLFVLARAENLHSSSFEIIWKKQ